MSKIKFIIIIVVVIIISFGIISLTKKAKKPSLNTNFTQEQPVVKTPSSLEKNINVSPAQPSEEKIPSLETSQLEEEMTNLEKSLEEELGNLKGFDLDKESLEL